MKSLNIYCLANKNYIVYCLLLLFYFLVFCRQLHGQNFVISSPLPRIKVTSPFGVRIHPLYKIPKFHYGVDLFACTDTVRSILDGFVMESGYKNDLGNYLTSKHGEIEILYAHLSCIYVSPQDSLCAGDPIGLSGFSGTTTGEHLHLAVKINGKHIDPIKFLNLLYYKFINIKTD